MDAARKAELDDLFAETPYAVVSELDQGTVADVFVVRQKFLRKKFALKLLRPQLTKEVGQLDRLRREARCLGKIDSPHVVEIVDMAITKNGSPYIVLDLMKGHSIARELELHGRLSIEQAVQWASQALLGLRAAHEVGLVHRDITPENLFLETKAGWPRTLKVMDFGLARLVPNIADSGLHTDLGGHTSTGTIVGSPAYASPEALQGERLTAAADIFAVGLVLFRMLTGKGLLDLDVASVPPPSHQRPEVPTRLDEIVLKATRDQIEERYPTAAEFLADLDSLSDSSVTER